MGPFWTWSYCTYKKFEYGHVSALEAAFPMNFPAHILFHLNNF